MHFLYVLIGLITVSLQAMKPPVCLLEEPSLRPLANDFVPIGELFHYETPSTVKKEEELQAWHNDCQLIRQGSIAKALQQFSERIKTPEPWSLHNYALLQLLQNNTQEAFEYLSKAIWYEIGQSMKLDTKTLIGLSKIHLDLKTEHITEAYANTILNQEPDNPYGHIIKGIYEITQGNFITAITQFLQTTNSEFSTKSAVLEHLAKAYNATHQHVEALKIYLSLLDEDPKSKELLCNIGYTYKKIGHFDQAEIAYQRAITLAPNYAEAQFGLGLMYLSQGDYQKGFPLYEWRWKLNLDGATCELPGTRWNGESLTQKHLLVHFEQGIGDTFMFIRFLQELKSQTPDCTITLVAQRPLKKLLESCTYIDHIITANDTFPEYDYWTPLLSVPAKMNITTNDCNRLVPYITPDPTTVHYWKEKLAEDKNFKIGICFAAQTNYQTPYLQSIMGARCMPPEYFEQIAQLPGVSVYCLQQIPAEELKQKCPSVKHLGDDFDRSRGAFTDTAAIETLMDVNVMVDTSIPNLAIALGTKVLLMLPHDCDWRWGTTGTTTHWSPHVTLFRQPTHGDWQSVINAVIGKIKEDPRYLAISNI